MQVASTWDPHTDEAQLHNADGRPFTLQEAENVLAVYHANDAARLFAIQRAQELVAQFAPFLEATEQAATWGIVADQAQVAVLLTGAEIRQLRAAALQFAAWFN